ncbi:MAG: hypothetical protein DMF83_08930 [Acidobacteria bacterium]|nr:MAG: hypothetical protein DMF83_08930 [Acidobacteriota bacterium]
MYAFNAYNLSQLPRIQLVSLQWLPLALLCLHRFFVSGRIRDAFGAAGFSLLHGLACFYYLAFYAVALVILVPVAAWTSHGWRKARAVAALVSIATVACSLLGFVAWPYASLFRHYGFTGESAGVDLARYLLPPYGSLPYPALGASQRGMEVDYFLGYIALALAGLGLVRLLRGRAPAAWTPVLRAYAVLGLVSILLSAGSTLRVKGVSLGPGPFRLLQASGPFAELREPARFAMLVNLALATLVAVGAAALLSALRSPRRATVACFLLLPLLAAEHWSLRRTRGLDIPAAESVPEAYRWLARWPGDDPVAELPPRPFGLTRLTSLEAYFSTLHRKRILFARPSFFPPAYELLQWQLRDFPDERSITLLRALGFRLALVHPKRWGAEDGSRPPSVSDSELPLLAEFPDRDDPTWSRYQLGAEQVRAIPPLSAEGTPRACDCREIDRRTLRLDATGNVPPAWAVDGDRRTRWRTPEKQHKGSFFEIAFDRPRRPVRLEIEMTYPYGEFARNMAVTGFLGDEERHLEVQPDIWYDVALVRQLIRDPRQARLRYDLAPEAVDRLRLYVHRTERGAPAWSIPEIHVYEPSGG